MSQKPTDAVKEWVEAQKRPYAKLMRGFESSVNDFLKHRGFDFSSLPRTTEIAVVKLFDGLVDNDNINDFRSKQKLQVSMAKELINMGCPVWAPWPHSYHDDQNQKHYEMYLPMPFQKPNESFGHDTIGMPPEPRTLPNFEGQVNFLAYLMRKSYVTEADAPRGEDPRAPFSAAMFGFAKVKARELNL